MTLVGYLVATTGRLLLPPQLERQALTVVEHRMATREGWFDPDTEHQVDTLGDLAAYAGVTLSRHGDWLTVTTDHEGDPKWSDQAEEFYVSLAEFVREGEVHLRGEDGSTWSYAYSPAGLQQGGGAGGAGVPAPSPSTPVAPPTPAPPSTPSAPSAPAPEPPPSAQPPAEEQGGFSYPGKEQRPAAPRQPPSTPPPGMQDAGWAGVDEDPPPAPPGRVLLMSVVLVVGVLLIIGLALLVSGF